MIWPIGRSAATLPGRRCATWQRRTDRVYLYDVLSLVNRAMVSSVVVVARIISAPRAQCKISTRRPASVTVTSKLFYTVLSLNVVTVRHEHQQGAEAGRAAGRGGGQLLPQELLARRRRGQRLPATARQPTSSALHPRHARVFGHRGRNRVLLQRKRGPHQGVRAARVRRPSAERRLHHFGHLPIVWRRAPALGRLCAHSKRLRVAVGQRRGPAAPVAARQAFQDPAAERRQGRCHDHRLPAVQRPELHLGSGPDGRVGHRHEQGAVPQQGPRQDQPTAGAGARQQDGGHQARPGRH